ncbi:MAG: radical SAM protein [Deltaproteobacteria bacterium]|nr:radical SAM protein [Deltaproteobacteria bacterium]
MGEKRYVDDRDLSVCKPIYAVWEITLKCDLSCAHCGSRAGSARVEELSTAECLDIVRQLAAMGCREVTIIGGEAYLRKDWTTIIKAIRDAGMDASMTTGGKNLTEKRVVDAARAGLQQVSVSVDGLEDVHDQIRGVSGSYAAAMRSIALLKQHGIKVGVNSQINALSMPQLPEIMERIIAAGAVGWQLQLTVAMGNAVENPELLLQPYELLTLMPTLAELYDSGTARGLTIVPGNNIGYFGPYERLWRGGPDGQGHWIGCNAGQNTIGLEADGTIKGCPSLPTAEYSGGNIRDLSLEEIWRHSAALRFARERTVDDLSGHCRTCYYADLCRGGCSWTTHALFGKPGNNPYCHYRALQLEKRGLRERVVKVKDAPGLPFDRGEFALVEEAIDAEVSRPMPQELRSPRSVRSALTVLP